MDAETIYHKLREAAESFGFVPDEADDALAQASNSIADFAEENPE